MKPDRLRAGPSLAAVIAGLVALLVFVDDRLVCQLVGGQPTINACEVQRSPLGPLQGWGDQMLQTAR